MRELAVDGISISVSLRVLKLSRAPYYRWLKQPVSDTEWREAYRASALYDAHKDDPQFGYRLLADEAEDAGQDMCDRTAWKICSENQWWSTFGKKKGRNGKKPGPSVHDDLCAYEDKHGVIRHQFTATGPNELWLTDISEHWTRRIPAVVATVNTYAGSSKAAIRSAGVSQPSDFRGRPFSSSAIMASCSNVNWRRSAPLGRY